MLNINDFFFRNSLLRCKINSLQKHGLLEEKTPKDVLDTFGLLPSLELWKFFLGRTLAVLGVLLILSGVIFYFAANWDTLSKMQQFALVQGVLVLFGAIALWKWQSWLREPAMLGVALGVGAMLALFGQTYQTGADAWQLFMIWTLILLPLALSASKPSLWLVSWITGSLWILRYLYIEYDVNMLSFDFVMIQIVLWAICEGVVLYKENNMEVHHALRWLPRIIGIFAFTLLVGYLMFDIFWKDIMWSRNDLRQFIFLPSILRLLILPLYCALLAAMYKFYTTKQPDMLFISLGVFGTSALFISLIIKQMINAHAGIDSFLVVGVVIVAVFIGSLKIILLLRKKIKTDAVNNVEGTLSKSHKHELDKKELLQSLEHWLVNTANQGVEEVKAFFFQEEQKDEHATVWYMNIPMILGVWIGVLCISVFLIIQLNAGLGWFYLPIGVALCYHSSVVWRQLGFCLIFLGLFSVGYLLAEEYGHYSLLDREVLSIYFIIFTLLWLSIPSMNAKTISFTLALHCAFLYFTGFIFRLYDSYSVNDEQLVLIYKAIEPIGVGFFVIVFFISMFSLLNEVKNFIPANKYNFNVFDQKRSLELGGIIFCALLAVTGIIDVPFNTFASKGLSLGLAIFSLYFLWKRKDLILLTITCGTVLVVLSYFQPFIAMGLVLYVLGLYLGNRVFVGTASLYLGASVVWYYYSLKMTLHYKSFILMGSGLAIILLSFVTIKVFSLLETKKLQGTDHAN